MKKFLFALLATSLLFCAVSCGDDDEGESTPIYSATVAVGTAAGSEYINTDLTRDVTVSLTNTAFKELTAGDVTGVTVSFGDTSISAKKVALKENVGAGATQATFAITYEGTEAKTISTPITIKLDKALIAAGVDITGTSEAVAFTFLAPDVQISAEKLVLGVEETIDSTITVTLNNGKTFSNTATALVGETDISSYISFDNKTENLTIDSTELANAVTIASTKMTVNIKATGVVKSSGSFTVTIKRELITGATEDVTATIEYSVGTVAVLSTNDVLTGICSAAETVSFALELKGGEFDTEKIATLGYNNASDKKHYVKDVFKFSFSNAPVTVNWVCLESVTSTEAVFTVDYATPSTASSGNTTCSVTIVADALKDTATSMTSRTCETAYDFTKKNVTNADGTNTLIIQEGETENGFVSCSVENVSTNGTWTGYTGKGFYENLGENSSIVYSIYAEKDVDDVSIDVRYALWSDAERAILVNVNGTVANASSGIYTPTTSKQKNTAEGRWKYSGALTGISLKAGNNSITLTPAEANAIGTFNGASYIVGQKAMVNIDYVKITGTGISAGTGEYYTLAYYTENEDFGTVAETNNKTGTVNKDTSVTLTASPKSGYKFDCWMGTSPSRENPYTFTVNKNIVLQAHFIPESVTANPTDLVGYAAITGDDGTAYTITGGAGATAANTITISSRDELIANKVLLTSDTPAIITIKGTIQTTGLLSEQYTVGSNKTIYGDASNQGRLKNIELNVQGQNVIIRNMMFGEVISWDEPVKSGADDALSLNGARHVWIDHCEFQSHLQPQDLDGNPITSNSPYYSTDSDWAKDFYDGLLDIKNGASWITISNCYFHDHYKACLCASGDDSPKSATIAGLTLTEQDMRVTFYGNYWKNINARQPMFRYGKFHVFDSYFNAGTQSGGASCINVRAGAEAYIEGNTFVGIKSDDYTVGFYYADAKKKYGTVSGTWTTTNNTGKIDQSTSSYKPLYTYTSSKVTEEPIPGTNVGVGVLTASDLN